MSSFIQYYSPNLSIRRLLSSFLYIKDSIPICERFYRSYTNKKYILFTNSCRSALCLAYMSIGKKGSVVTSPLICKTALLPIVKAGNRIIFANLSKNTLNINCDELPEVISSDTIAMQITYLGGRPIEVDKIKCYTEKHGLILIEDCAQGFGSKYGERFLGTYGDIVCLSMIKTGYGISGGVFATDNYEYFCNARDILCKSKSEGLGINLFRTIRNVLETQRTNMFGNKLYELLMNIRPNNFKRSDGFAMKRPNKLSFDIFATTIPRWDEFISQREKNARKISEKLNVDIYCNYSNDIGFMAPTKLYIYKEGFLSQDVIALLKNENIEAMHLQQKFGSPYQDSLNDVIWRDYYSDMFLDIHDCLVSIPLYEKMTDSQIKMLTDKINYVYGKQKDNLV